MTRYRITQIEDYEPLIGTENVDRGRKFLLSNSLLRPAVSWTAWLGVWRGVVIGSEKVE
jgi:hypothetical protein